MRGCVGCVVVRVFGRYVRCWNFYDKDAELRHWCSEDDGKWNKAMVEKK